MTKLAKFLFLGFMLSVTPAFLVHAAEPSLTSITVSSLPSAGGGTYYDSGETISFQVDFAAPATITGGGNPRLAVEIAGNSYFANYASGSLTSTWQFNLSVAPGMNDANGISATAFDLTNGGISDAGTLDPLVTTDFADVAFAGVSVDADAPDIASYSSSSTAGNLVGGTRYLRAGQQFVVTVGLNSPDTRGTTSVDLTVGGAPLNLAFTGTATAGTSTSYQRTSPSSFIDSVNGALVLTNLNYQDAVGKTPALVPAPTNETIVVDNILPAISFTNNVNPTPTANDTIGITVTDTNAPTPNAHEYGFSADAICDATDTYGNAFTSGTTFNITTEAQNGNYICVRATDLAGNVNYLASANPLNIDVTPPSITGTTQTTTVNWARYVMAGETVTYTITYSENVTVTAVNTASSATNATGAVTEVSAAASSTDTLVVTVQAGDNGEIVPSVDYDIQDAAGNTVNITSLGTITGGGFDNKVFADTTAPTITTASIVSNNANNTAWAKSGDTVTLNFVASEELINTTVSANIAGKVATVTSQCGNASCTNYQAQVTLDGSETEGVVAISIDFQDRAQNAGTTVTSTTDTSSVTFDNTAPTLPTVSIASNNALDTSLAKTNDTVTVTATVNDNLSSTISLVTSSILGNAITANTMTATGAGRTISRFTDGTETSEVVVPFTLQVADIAGNVSALVNSVTDGSSVQFDRTNPVTQEIKLTATSIDNSAYTADAPTYYAKQGDTITLVMQICDYVDSQNNPPTGTLFGQAVTMADQGLVGAPGNCTTGAGNTSQWRNWQAQITNINGTEGLVTFNVTAKDNAGNELVNITGTTDGSQVIFDKTVPTNPTDVVDLGGLATPNFKPVTDAVYSWTNDTDPLGVAPVSGVQQFDVRYFNPNTGINESVTVNAPTRTFTPTTVIPDNDPYDVFMSVVDKAGNASTEATTYTQKYGITIKGSVTEDSTGNPLENTGVSVISAFGEECQTGQNECVTNTDANGDYEIVVAPNQDYVIDFIKTPNHYMAKTKQTFTTNPATIDTQLELVNYPEIQTETQLITIITDLVINPNSSGNTPLNTEIFVDSASGEIETQEVNGAIIITSFGEINDVQSNNPAVTITQTGPNTYEVTNAGSIRVVVDSGTQSGGVTTTFASGGTRGGANFLDGGPSITSFNGVRREDRLSQATGMSYRESMLHAQKMNEGAPRQTHQYVNRNGYVVFGGYQSGTLPLSKFKRFDQTKHIVFRGQKTGARQMREFADNQSGAPQLVAVRSLFKSTEDKDTVVIQDGDNTIIVRAAEERVSTIKGQNRKSMPGYGKKVSDMQTAISKRIHEEYDFNPFYRAPREVNTPESRIQPKNINQVYVRHGKKKVALGNLFNQGVTNRDLVVRQ